MAELYKRKEKMSKCACVCACMWKPVLQHFHTCLLETMITVGVGQKSLWRGSCIALVWKNCLKLLLASGLK